MPVRTFTSPIALLLFASCQSAAGGEAAPSGDRVTAAELPVLAGTKLRSTTLVRPITDGEMPSFHEWELPEAQRPVAGPGFADGHAAIAAVRAWLVEHYSPGAAAASLVVHLVEYRRESNTVLWRQDYAGLPTDVRGGIEFAGTTPVSAWSAPVALAPIAGSQRPLIGTTEALAAWQQVAKNRGLDLAGLAAADGLTLLPVPQLRFVKSFLGDAAGWNDERTWRPAWLLDESSKLGVDAHTGTPWYEFDSQTLSTTPVAQWDVAATLVGPAMPLIRMVPLAPIVDPEAFREEHGEYRFPKVPQTPGPAIEPPYATDELAIAAAKAWLTRHFGPLPDKVSLIPADVTNPDNPTGSFAMDQGHSILLRASYDGALTDCYTDIDLVGKTVSRASVHLFTPLPIADSTKPTLTRQGAIEAMLHELAVAGTRAEVVEQYREKMTPRLEYVRSGRVDMDFRILVPNWSIAPQSTLFIDAHTGKVWRND